jgi:hypothetical protein
MQQGDLVGLSLLAVYGLGFLCVGTISHRIRFIGNNARTSSGYAWILSYHKLLFAVTILGFGLLLIVQPFINIDRCMADSIRLYTDKSTLTLWRYSRTFAHLIVACLCIQIIFVRRTGSRGRHRNSNSTSSGTQFSFDMNWEAICQVCMFHLGCRAIHFVSVVAKTLLKDTTCYPIGSQFNSVSFDACYAGFWLLTLMRLPIALSSHNPEAVDSYSFANYIVRSCQGKSSRSELLFFVTSICFIFSQVILLLYYDFGRGRHTLRQIYYGLGLGVIGHGLTSANVNELFINTPQANMPTSRNNRLHRVLVPITNSTIAYFMSFALSYRVLRDKHKTMMWKDVLSIYPLMGDLCIALLFIFGIVRKGARRQGYVQYQSVLPSHDFDT